ncbi:MAG: hypothetical protein IJ057_01175 [Bacteroidales bacterium]|nr:hypothetical protein [Bacteroidales bacterium]
MGFFRNLFDEFGTKTGSAIGNALFPNSTDYVRLGDLNGNTVQNAREIAAAQSEAEQERIEAQLVADKMRTVLCLQFDMNDMDHNLNVLTQLAAIMDSLPSWFNRSDEEKRVYKTAKSKMKAGLRICKTKDPNNLALNYFEEKYD